MAGNIQCEEVCTIPVLLPNLCRKIRFNFRKHEDQFLIVHANDSNCLFDVSINRMVREVMSKGFEDPETIFALATLSLSPDLEQIEQQLPIVDITIHFPIPLGVNNLTELLNIIKAKDLTQFLGHEMVIHGINEEKGFVYFIDLRFDQIVIDRFIDMLAEYYDSI